eukprot:7181598-Alexandrium_andersonii.AAC.1
MGGQRAAPLPQGLPHPPPGQAWRGAGCGQGWRGQDVPQPPTREGRRRHVCRGHEGRQGTRRRRL